MENILYSTDCPKCKILEAKLNENGITFEKNEDVNEMLALGLKSAPAFKHNDQIMSFNEALVFIKNYTQEVTQNEE